jgi:ribosome-binding protein aMBF1 (putative translation factor)
MAQEKGGKSEKDQTSDVFEYASPEQKEEMEEKITKENCGKKMKFIREVTGISRRDLAKVLGMSESTIGRLETGKTKPTEGFMNKLRALVVIGYAKYSKMSKKEKEKLSEYIGLSGGVVAGVGGAIGAVSASGVVAGLSASGITSGLAALGGGMVGGMMVIATIPMAVGAAGFGLVKGVKAICAANRLNCKEVDGNYEIVPMTEDEGNVADRKRDVD